MGKHFKLLFFLLITLVAGGFLVFFLQKYLTPSSNQASVVIPTFVQAESPQLTQISPDGKELLTLKKEPNKEVTTYTFTTVKGAFYSMTIPSNILVSLPFNTWSPDDKYFFIKQDSQFIVITPKGESINVNEKFVAKYPNLTLTDATGWASNNLLILNSNKADGSKNPSIWFEVTSGAFIQLSGRFD